MPEALNISKKESHLKEGVKPIHACIGTPEDFSGKSVYFSGKFPIEYNRDKAEDVNFDEAHTNKFLNSGSYTYVISDIDSKNKFSENFFDCTGVVAAGIDKKSGKQVSFLSHQNPLRFLHTSKDEFIKDLGKRLLELKEKCESGTVDVVVIGGMYIVQEDRSTMSNEHVLNYKNSIKLIGQEVKKTLGFDPVVINGPKTHDYDGDKHDEYPDKIYYKNEDRQLYFMRLKPNSNTKDFASSEIDSESEKWKGGKVIRGRRHYDIF